VSFLYLPVGDCLGVPLLALLFIASLLASGPVARDGGGGRGCFSFRSGGGGGGGAELCCPHLGGVGEDATSRIKAAGIHLAGGGWGGEARAGCARAGAGYTHDVTAGIKKTGTVPVFKIGKNQSINQPKTMNTGLVLSVFKISKNQLIFKTESV
jgi:hypothetical protein